jgi:hypothetical protein
LVLADISSEMVYQFIWSNEGTHLVSISSPLAIASFFCI